MCSICLGMKEMCKSCSPKVNIFIIVGFHGIPATVFSVAKEVYTIVIFAFLIVIVCKYKFVLHYQGGILCCGKAPPSMPKEWKTMNTDTEIQPVVVTPKLLEMDVRRYLCKECR